MIGQTRATINTTLEAADLCADGGETRCSSARDRRRSRSDRGSKLGKQLTISTHCLANERIVEDSEPSERNLSRIAS